MTTDEIIEELKELQTQIERPFIRVVLKPQKRVRNNKVYVYRYWYLQWDEKGKTKTIYLGKKIPFEVQRTINLQKRYMELKRELKRRLKKVGG